jgi:2-succinyl-5-enolpyruvyl-6-hydroxy-3-cyclohexene-1-carboxylate synthase
MLPQRDLPEHGDLFVTPHEADVGGLTAAAGAGHRLVERATDLEPSLEAASRAGGLQVIEVVVDPERSVVRRSEMRDAIASALR